MGTRIEFYAVDTVPFKRFLERSLASALRFAAQSGSQRNPLWFQTASGRYLASPEDGIVRGDGKRYVRLTDAQIDADTNLTGSYGNHLAEVGTAQLGSLIRVLADSSATPWVHELSSGYYWWWVCSLVGQLELALPQASKRDRYRSLFARVLSGVPCGIDLPVERPGTTPTGFPVIPGWEDEHWAMGVWSKEDISCFVESTSAMLAREITFCEPAGMDVRRRVDWNEWVRAMLDQLIEIRRLEYDRPAMISFIG